MVFFCKASISTAKLQDLQFYVGDAAGSMPVYFFSISPSEPFTIFVSAKRASALGSTIR